MGEQASSGRPPEKERINDILSGLDPNREVRWAASAALRQRVDAKWDVTSDEWARFRDACREEVAAALAVQPIDVPLELETFRRPSARFVLALSDTTYLRVSCAVGRTPAWTVQRWTFTLPDHPLSLLYGATPSRDIDRTVTLPITDPFSLFPLPKEFTWELTVPIWVADTVNWELLHAAADPLVRSPDYLRAGGFLYEYTPAGYLRRAEMYRTPEAFT